jgi:UPF0755 protein
VKKAILVILICVVALAGIGAVVIWTMIQNYESAAHQGSGKSVAVEIPKGSGPYAVATLLAENKVIDDPAWFVRYVRYYKRAAGKLKAGELAFRDNMTPEQVLQVLLHGTPVTHKITVPEGLRLDEWARLFEEAGLADAREFETRARDKDLVKSLGLPGDSLEGFLNPETYHFRKQTPVDTILSTLVAGYKKGFTDEYRQRAKELGLSELEVVTLASIVEKETGAAQERALISGVFHNRLRENWRLDTDPTVIYAVLLSRGSFSGNLTREDLAIDHPYNTYRHKGLPPGPICSPGHEAIKAALFPKKTKNFFFVSRNDGTHHFCPTLSCHNAAVKRYQGGG